MIGAEGTLKKMVGGEASGASGMGPCGAFGFGPMLEQAFSKAATPEACLLPSCPLFGGDWLGPLRPATLSSSLGHSPIWGPLAYPVAFVTASRYGFLLMWHCGL